MLGSYWIGFLILAAGVQDRPLDTAKIEEITGLKGTLNKEEGVFKALRKSDINIVAIHHHMIFETPRMLFLHYWGRGKSVDLARAIKTALDLQKK